MKKISLIVIFSLVLLPVLNSCKEKKADQNEDATTETEVMAEEEEAPMNGLSASEKADGWVMLFDGTTSEGWRGYKKDHFPSGWQIEDGAIKCAGSGRGEAGSEDGGDILYDKQFQNFTLSLEWKISEGGNSGIFYLGTEEFDVIYKSAPEMQILDNERHPDAKLGKDGNRMSGSLYDLIPAKPQNAKPAGEWNKIELTVYKGTVVHNQNGVNVLEYHLWTPEWKEMVANSKFPSLNPDWANVASKGYFALQDHGDDVWFRNIKIKEL